MFSFKALSVTQNLGQWRQQRIVKVQMLFLTKTTYNIHSSSYIQMRSVMGPVPKFLELRSVPFFFSKVELVPFPFPISKTGTSSVPVPFPFI